MMQSIASQVNASLTAARKEWGWLLAVGIALMALGAAAIIYDQTATTVSVAVIGGIIFAAGIVQVFAAFQARGAGHVVLYLLMGALELVVGFVIMQDPDLGALSLTLVLSVYFMFSGIFRVIYSLWLQLPNYGWAVLSGIVSLALGIVLLEGWPMNSAWFVGFAVGVNFIFYGISWSTLALKLKPATE